MTKSYDPFDNLSKQFKNSGIDLFTSESVKWWRTNINKMIGEKESYKSEKGWIDLHKSRYGSRSRKSPHSGKMYMFHYEPTTKKKLKYWDTLPLIFALEKTAGGFYGLNLHYIPRKKRSLVLQHMVSRLKNATGGDVDEGFEGEKLRDIRSAYKTYDRVKNDSSLYKYIYPCIKRYKNKGIKSNLIEIPVIDWEIASYLPSDIFFERKSLQSVHQDGIHKVRKKFK